MKMMSTLLKGSFAKLYKQAQRNALVALRCLFSVVALYLVCNRAEAASEEQLA
jgi:hypothetical protein